MPLGGYGVRRCPVIFAGQRYRNAGVKMDPAEISTLPELAAALDQLRRGRSLQVLADAAAKLPARGGRQPALPRSTASDLLNARYVPAADTVVTFLSVCGVAAEEAQRPWLQAIDRIASRHQRCPPGAVRVRAARPRLLGVHAAIRVEPPTAASRAEFDPDELPPYVPRDFDADLREKLRLAGRHGGFVLLVGSSSVGKTRGLFEAVRAVLPDWWLLHPGNAEDVREFAEHPASRTVVWLDELQDYLDHAGGVPWGHVRSLIAAGVVLTATCWPEEHSKRVALRSDGQPDPYANDRRLLDLADVLPVPGTFSADERRRAEDVAVADQRVRVALDTPDAGFTQVMAAGPELIRHWNEAPAEHCYGKAVITAALDARRVGAHAPLTRAYFEDAAPGYMNERQVATASPDWLDGALDYATTLLRGATSALTPVAAGMGSVAGYQVADYLHQHALRARRTEPLPDAAWRALISHHHPDDTQRIAYNAERRGRANEAVSLYQPAADSGNVFAVLQLAELLVKQEQPEDAIHLLRSLADTGDADAAVQLVNLLADREQADELRTLADSGDVYASSRLIDLLVEQERVEDLRALAASGNDHAALRLAKLLVEQEQVENLRALAASGNDHAALRLTKLLAKQGKAEDAISVLRSCPDRNEHTDAVLAQLLADHGQAEEAVRVLRSRAGSRNSEIVIQLAHLLMDQGQAEEAIRVLRARADGDDPRVAYWLAQFQVEQIAPDDLPAVADSGNSFAAHRLARLLADQERVEELRDIADRNEFAAAFLAQLLLERAEVADAIDVLRVRVDTGDAHAAWRLVDLLVEQGGAEHAICVLRPYLERGDDLVAPLLVSLLAEQGLSEELEAEVAAGTEGAADALRRVRSRKSDARP